MTPVTVSSVSDKGILFSDGSLLRSEHTSDCCESHYLDFTHLSLGDFLGLTFDLSGAFFERVPGYGIRLCPIKGYPIPVPGYGSNNGYYSDNLRLVVVRPGGKTVITYDIVDCQRVSG